MRTIPIFLPADADVLHTVQQFQSVQQDVSKMAYDLITNQAGDQWEPPSVNELHHACYTAARGRINSQMICTAIRLVAGNYRSARAKGHAVRKPFGFGRPLAMWLGGLRGRDVSLPADGTLSLSTVAGRKHLTYTVPQRFRELLASAVCVNSLSIALVPSGRGRGGGRQRDHDVEVADGRAADRLSFQAWLTVTLEAPDPAGHSHVGIDRGSINFLVAVAADDRVLFLSGREHQARNERTRQVQQRARRKKAARRAQKKDTHSLRRLLKRLSRKQQNRNRTFAQQAALALCRWAPAQAVFALEDLRLPAAQPVRRDQVRGRLTGWFHGLLGQCIKNKAQERGIPILMVSAAFTSQTCSRCGERGRRRGLRFFCPRCGHTEHADVNAARNIRDLAAQPA